MTRLALCLLTLLVAACGGSSAPAVNPEALRQRAAACRIEGRPDEAATLLDAAVRAQPTSTRDQRPPPPTSVANSPRSASPATTSSARNVSMSKR